MKLVRAKEGYRKVGDKWLIAKKCTKCGKWKVASMVNFQRVNKGRYGLRGDCKACQKPYQKQYYENNKEKLAEYGKQWRLANKEKIAEIGKRYREANKDKIAESSKRYYQANKEKIADRNKRWHEANPEYYKQYYEANKDKERERSKQYYEANKDKHAEYYKQYNKINKDKVNERNKRYNKANKDKIAEQQKQWRQSPQGKVALFNINHRRRIREEEQGTGITKDQWLEMMKFFDFRCAYSGEVLSKKTRSVDHIVPISTGGDNMIWNMVPMTRSLNSSKRDKDMLEWYKEQDFYDPKRLQKIYDWQEYAYNKWGKQDQEFAL